MPSDSDPRTDTTVVAAPAPVTAERVLEATHRLGLRYFVDDEGDVGIPWRCVVVHVIFQDTRAVQLRGTWHRIADTEHLLPLRSLVEEWNATRIGPKAFLTVGDGGIVLAERLEDAAALNAALVDAGVAVGALEARSMSLENYYTELVKGA